MNSEKFPIKLLPIGLLIIVIVSSTLVVGFLFINNNLGTNSNKNSSLTINSIAVSQVSQSEYNRNGYYYPSTPPPAKVIYGLMFNATIFLNKTYSFNIWRANLGLCTFHADFVNTTDWDFVPYVTSCPIADKYNEGNTSFLFYEEIIPSNYNNTISYPIQLSFTASSNTGFPVNVTSEPFTLQINN